MDVAIDEPRHHRETAEVDDPGSGRHPNVTTDCSDPFAGQDDRDVAHRRARPIDETAHFHHDRGGLAGYRAGMEGGDEQTRHETKGSAHRTSGGYRG